MFRRLLMMLALGLSVTLAAQTSPDYSRLVVPENDRASTEDLERFIVAMRLRQQMENMFQVMRAQFATLPQQALGEKYTKLTPEQQQKCHKTLQVVIDEAFSQIKVDDMIADVLPVYQKYVSKEDLQTIVDFYSSPTGQRLLDRNPVMIEEAMKISVARMQKLVPELTARLEKRISELTDEEGRGEHQTPEDTSGAPLKNK